MGYPRLMSRTCFGGPTPTDSVWMSDIAEMLNDSLQLAVGGVDPLATFTYFANPEAAFAGHGACSRSGEYIHHLIHTRAPGEKPSVLPVAAVVPPQCGRHTQRPTRESPPPATWPCHDLGERLCASCGRAIAWLT